MATNPDTISKMKRMLLLRGSVISPLAGASIGAVIVILYFTVVDMGPSTLTQILLSGLIIGALPGAIFGLLGGLCMGFLGGLLSPKSDGLLSPKPDSAKRILVATVIVGGICGLFAAIIALYVILEPLPT